MLQLLVCVRARAVLTLLIALLLLLLSCALSSVSAALSLCGSPVDGSIPASPSVPVPPPALFYLNSTAFSLPACLLTFADFEDGHRDWVTCYHAPRVSVHTCPQQCLRSVEEAPDRARVYGSGPYAAASSICLAGIHSGVLDDAKGGAVHVGPFYPQDWSQSSTQTIFPSRSRQGSVSRGVNASQVPAEMIGPEPSPLSSNSWTVRGRGIVPRQRQVAPFPPRSGHVHASFYPQLQLRANWSTGVSLSGRDASLMRATFNYSLHFIIGGRNASHYLNDCWLFHSLTGSAWDDPSAVNRHSSHNGRWYHLPDAPFTPRADMAYHTVLYPLPAAFSLPTPPANLTVLVLYGGETNYACGNRWLGVCSDEVWQLSVSRVEQGVADADAFVEPELGLSFEWSLSHERVPPPRRCGFAPLFERRQGAAVYNAWATGIAGGQRSYDDPTCRAEVETLDDQWFGLWPYSGRPFSRRAPPPFSPRRGVQVDDALVSTDELISWDEESPMDKSLTVTGGIRFLHQRFDAHLGRSVMEAAEVYADAWTCAIFVDLRSLVADCDWHYSYPVGRPVNVTVPTAPSSSLPWPLVQSASVHFPGARADLNMRLWGSTVEAAVRDFSHIPVPSVSDGWRLPFVNVSLLAQPSGYRSRSLPDTGATGWGEVIASRHHLPLSYRLSVDELNELPNTTSSLIFGSPLVFSHTLLYQNGAAKAQFTAVGDGRRHWAEDGSGRDTWATLRRVGHSMVSQWDLAIVSGGQSGAVVYNDWLTLEGSFCFFPEDPSYERQLGAIRFLREAVVHERSYQRYWTAPARRSSQLESFVRPSLLGAFRSGDQVEVSCAPGWHFHPPLEAEEALLTCAANSLWLDVQLGGVRQCVPDSLMCPYPLVDAGYSECSEPAPIVEAVDVVTAMANRRAQPSSQNAGTVLAVPTPESVFVTGQLLLRITGRWLTEPAEVFVSAQQCTDVRLRNVSTYCADEAGELTCRDFATVLLCLMDEQIGVRDQVSISVGRGLRRRTFSSISLPDSTGGRTPLTVSVVEPQIVSVMAPPGLCNVSAVNNASLVNCAHDEGELPVRLCGTGFGFRSDEMSVDVSVNVSLGSALLRCGQWSISQVDRGQCDPAASSFVLCTTLLFCGQCSVPPAISRQSQLLVQRRLASGQLVSSARQNDAERTAASVSFAGCAAGRMLVRVNETDQCAVCSAGSSTDGLANAVCKPCSHGYHSSSDGAALCEACPAGAYAEGSAAVQCRQCESNSWQPQAAQAECKTCEVGQYRSLPLGAVSNSTASPTSGSVVGECAACPSGAECHANGTIVALPGYFVVLQNSVRGWVAAVDCFATTACVGGVAFSQSQPITVTGLLMANTCGFHRKAAFSPLDESSNLLCAQCEDDYTVVKGDCIYCPSPSYGGLVIVLLTAFVFVYALHRVTLQLSNSATLSVMVYFVQMSALFLPSDAVLPLLGLLSVSLVDGGLKTCLIPLDDYGTIGARLLSPVIAMLLLALMLGLQIAVRHCLRKPTSTQSRVEWMRKVYDLLLPPSTLTEETSESPAVHELLLPEDEHSSHGHLSVIQRVAPSAQQPDPFLQLPLLSDDTTSLNAKPILLWADALPDEEQQPRSDAVPDAEPSSLNGSIADIVRCYHRTWIRLTLFSYNAIAAQSVAYFHSRQLGEGQSRLWLYPSIDPSSFQYKELAPLMAFFLLLTVSCVPLLWLYLFKQRRKTEEGGVLQNASLPSLYALLTCSFQDRFWWMPVIVMGRRLLLILLLTFVTSSVYTWLTAVNSALLVLHVATWPYRCTVDNRLEAMTLTALAIQTTYLSTWISGRPEGGDVVVLLLFVVPCLMAAALIALHRFHQWKHSSLAGASSLTITAFLLAPFTCLTASSLQNP